MVPNSDKNRDRKDFLSSYRADCFWPGRNIFNFISIIYSACLGGTKKDRGKISRRFAKKSKWVNSGKHIKKPSIFV